VADDQAKYMVYSSSNPYSGWDGGTEVSAGSGTASCVINSSATELYFKIAVIVPNRCKADGKFYGYTTNDFGVGVDYASGIPVPGNSLYSWPDGWDFPVDYWDDSSSDWYYTDSNTGPDRYGIATVDMVYDDDDAYNVSKAGSKEISLDLEGTKYYLVALPFEGNYATGDDLFDYLNLTPGTEVVSAWDEVTQGWQSSAYNDQSSTWDIPFGEAEVNGVYMITATTTGTGEDVVPIDILLKGTIGESPVYNILETATTDLNFIMVPYEFSGTTAADLGTDMGTNNTIMISKWDKDSQSWISCVYIEGLGNWLNDFIIEPGMPVVIGAVQDFTWPNN
jgi:hypothetical protein